MFDDGSLELGRERAVQDWEGRLSVQSMSRPAASSAAMVVVVDGVVMTNGRRIAFASNRDGSPDIHTMRADGHDQVNRTDHDAFDYAPDRGPAGGRDNVTTRPAKGFTP
jgi:hypothetical protein